MGACDPDTSLSRATQKLATGDARGLLVYIEGDRDIGIGKLGTGAVHDVSPEQQHFTIRVDEIAGMAGRMAPQYDAFDAFDGWSAACESMEAATGLVFGDDPSQPLVVGLVGVEAVVGKPEIGFSLGYVELRIGKGQPMLSNEAPGMIGVEVRQKHGRHVFGRVTGGGKVGLELAKRIALHGTRTRIDQDNALAIVDQKCIDRCRHACRLLDDAQGPIDGGPRRPLELGAGDFNAAIVQCCQREPSQPHSEITGRLAMPVRGSGAIVDRRCCSPGRTVITEEMGAACDGQGQQRKKQSMEQSVFSVGEHGKGADPA